MDNKHERTIPERLAAIEVKVLTACNASIEANKKLDKIMPLVLENSWWIGKIKWAFVFISVVGVLGGIVAFAFRFGNN